MKISPMAAPTNTAPAAPDAAPAGLRSLRMNTNATPGRIDPQIESLPPAATPADAKSSTGDPNDPANATDEATQPLSPQLAAIAKQRRALQQERQEFERQKAEAAAKPSDGNAVDLARLKSDPLSVLLDAGVTYDQLTEAILASRDSGPDLQSLKANILKELEAGVEKKFADREQQTVQQYLDKETREAKTLIAQGDDFEVVRERGLIDSVPVLIKAVYEAEGIALTAKQALEELETAGLEEAMQLARIKKVQGKLMPEPVPQPQQQRTGMRTLTNRDTAAVPMDRKARALAAFRGTLNK